MVRINNTVREDQQSRYGAYLLAADTLEIKYPRRVDIDAAVIWLSKQDPKIWQAVVNEARRQYPNLFEIQV